VSLERRIEKEIIDKAKFWINEFGEEFLVELIEVYLEDTPKRLVELRRALETGDTPALTREAHTIKSSSANLGAMKISEIAKELENAGRVGATKQLAESVVRTEAEFELVRAALEALRSSPREFAFQER
jgi:HPt (histidine-containing phosphotransfer) domain-containing protein